ncbi:3-hydroxybutyryl-CoA dehydrogenase [Roseibium aggregatum IAM 12614]|uniref:3-hydroxybutyryl-CoA dehydrogenase n=1 Tax=Roseibium aggregatum (strain ATCC 25650 / DSM 13394 / JCM 20685 / NBRC 16684 / NCIMB 2208 / IAM 12614 / B1) TaxID=384765 RepID=A0NZG9_ROSAI|nr:carnitine 3-dehydrogenase [Roseibium aggregatum]EAV41848.1 3-hydroxybutyryl-CoA dehydrogenase [Roseibium aggregatum IAM 12614]
MSASRKRVAVIGGGVIGGGWAGRFLLNGWDVAVFDPAPEAERRIGTVLDRARASLPALYDRPLPAEGTLTFCSSIAEAVEGADWVQESVSERLELKHKVYVEIAAHLPEGGFIASSTSGFKASDLAAKGAPVVVVHPFNPVYLLPLVEISGEPALRQKAIPVVTSIGMHPLEMKTEIDAFIGNRFQESVWREALWMLKDGIATTAEIDDAIRMGFGLRWAQMGLFETYRIAGGEAGMESYIEQFGPTLQWPWSKLTDVPELDAALIKAIGDQSDAQSGHMTIAELETLRDDNLVAILRGLRRTGSGAGGVITRHEAHLQTGGEIDGLPITLRRVVPVTWTDYNGHMNEAAYLELGTWATDGLMHLVGADEAYIASGKSYFTVDTRIRYLDEVHRDEPLTVTTQVLDGSGKKMKLFHRVLKQDGGLCATLETLLLHTDLTTRRACAPEAHVAEVLEKLAADHAGRPAEGAGGAVGDRG